jgi:hypothetical protein
MRPGVPDAGLKYAHVRTESPVEDGHATVGQHGDVLEPFCAWTRLIGIRHGDGLHQRAVAGVFADRLKIGHQDVVRVDDDVGAGIRRSQHHRQAREQERADGWRIDGNIAEHGSLFSQLETLARQTQTRTGVGSIPPWILTHLRQWNPRESRSVHGAFPAAGRIGCGCDRLRSPGVCDANADQGG